MSVNYKLKMQQIFGDFSNWTFTGRYDADGGFCECGKKITYRYFVTDNNGVKIVGSTCIEHFSDNKTLFAQLKEADKINQKNHKIRLESLKSVNKYLEFVAKGYVSNQYVSDCNKFIQDTKQLTFSNLYSVQKETKTEFYHEALRAIKKSDFKFSLGYYNKGDITISLHEDCAFIKVDGILKDQVRYVSDLKKWLTVI